MTSFRTNSNTIVAAVGFDKFTDVVLNTAASLCKRAGFRLRIIHVCRDMHTGYEMFPSEFDLGQNFELQKAAEAAAARRLEELKKKVTGVTVETKVMSGDPADWINADAVAADAALIIVGIGRSSHRFIPTGWSTALSLMTHSSVPVMAVDEKHGTNFTKDRLKIVVADDLSEKSKPLVSYAMQLATAIKQVDLHHVHVSGLTQEALSVAITSAMATSHSGSDLALPAEDVFAAVLDKLRDKMAARMNGQRAVFEATGCRYFADLTQGEVTEQMHALVNKQDADLLLFGRHHTVRRKPFLIGRVPYYFMVSEHRPVVILPMD
jgi:nucleotide-binding universal stress UspA family protein